ncbi:MAG: hypothetical protein NXH95_15145 [Pseudomonadaceae bacterium]|nr:hypothetical protein [Pseudomonadaceae bacterium]
MEGTINVADKKYWWWAGPANDGAEERYCVHCRHETFGVTQYMDTEPDKQLAEETAKALVSKVDSVS